MKQTLRKLKIPALAAALLALPGLAAAQITTQDRFTVSEMEDDEGLHFLTVGLEGSRIYCAYNMTMTLPVGMTFYSSENSQDIDVYLSDDGIYPYTGSGSRKTYKHNVAGKTPKAPNVANIICTSQTNALFKTTSGTLFDVYVAYNAWTKAGENTVTMTGLNLTANEDIDGTLTAVKYVPEGDLNTGTITIPAEEREVTVNVSATNKWGTCVLPFSHTPSDFTAYKAANIADGVLYLQPVETMQAYKPYIIYAENGCTVNLTGTASEADFPEDGIAAEGALRGVLANTQVESGYIMQNKGDGVQFYRVGDTPFSLKAGRCYLASQQQNARLQIRILDGDETAITTPTAAQTATWYNLQGQSIAAPAHHGVYIYNGKKILK